MFVGFINPIQTFSQPSYFYQVGKLWGHIVVVIMHIVPAVPHKAVAEVSKIGNL